ncbi:hypothetical protein JTB14_030836 [Gonioctena quinquepunctata]|nr:hypothetical protein JTB14_030836 [Gonioctena quinquepunctata]
MPRLKKILILADETGRGLNKELRRRFINEDISSIIKPGASCDKSPVLVKNTFGFHLMNLVEKSYLEKRILQSLKIAIFPTTKIKPTNLEILEDVIFVTGEKT